MALLKLRQVEGVTQYCRTLKEILMLFRFLLKLTFVIIVPGEKRIWKLSESLTLLSLQSLLSATLISSFMCLFHSGCSIRIRRKNKEILGNEEISIGMWVGKLTKNSLTEQKKEISAPSL